MRRSVRNEKNIAMLTTKLAEYEKRIADLEADNTEFKRLLNEQTEDIARQLSQRWEKTLQSIADYDPFGNMGKTR